MAIAPGRLAAGLVVAVLTFASAPSWSQNDEWYEVSKAGLRAADEGRLRDAETLFRDALRLSDEYTEVDPRRATSVNNLAYILHAQGRYLAAEPHYRKSLAMREKALGADHPDVAQSCNNLAELYRVLGRYGEAEPLHQRALTIREKVFGPSHPEVAQTLNNLGVLHANQGRFESCRAAVQAGARDPRGVLWPRSPDDRRDPAEPGHALLCPGPLR